MTDDREKLHPANGGSTLQARVFKLLEAYRHLIRVIRLKFVLSIMKWITRERPKIDRIACPWLIKNFVDTEAEFIYVPKEQVFGKAKELNAIPYDIAGAEYSHY